MVKNIRMTQSDIDELVKRIYRDNPELITRHPYSSRYERLVTLGLVNDDYFDDYESIPHGTQPVTERGLALIQPILNERKRKQAESDARSLAYALEQNARDEAFKAELRVAGVTLFDHARADISLRMDRSIEYSVGFPITCRVEYARRENRYFIRAAVGHSGECDPDTLIEEARQAKIARDLLNAKLASEQAHTLDSERGSE